jgi:hypothetical protein
MKVRIKNWLQDVQQRLLNDSVANRRNTKMPFTAAEFRDRDPSDWLGLVSLAPQFAHQAIKFFWQARLKVTDRLPIRTRRAASAADFLERLR